MVIFLDAECPLITTNGFIEVGYPVIDIADLEKTISGFAIKEILIRVSEVESLRIIL